MSRHRKSDAFRSAPRDLWQLLAPAPISTRRRSSQMYPPSERVPGLARVVTLAVVALGAFGLQVARLWDMIP